jgi:anti-sigma regulatory factor (Ser/Thr protein kinase)
MTEAAAPMPTRRDVSLLAQRFDAEHITAVRHAVARCAAGVGLFDQRLEDFVLAVNEVITNAVRHAGGQGRVRLWTQDGTIRCEVTDEGGGIPPERLVGRELPPSVAVSGRGLWLARHLCDAVSVATGPAGTTILLVSGLVSAGA